MKGLALGFLLCGMCARFGWVWAPIPAQADVWNISGALYMAGALAVLLAVFYRSEEMVLVLVYLICLQLLTAGCSLWWLYAPWVPKPGEAQCDGAMNMPIALLGLYMGLMISLAVWSTHRGKTSNT